MDALSSFTAWSEFDCRPWYNWVVMDGYRTPFITVACYLALVAFGPRALRACGVRPMKLKALFCLWNLTLSAFSLVGASVSLRHSAHLLATRGLRYVVCSDALIFGPVSEFGTPYPSSDVLYPIGNTSSWKPSGTSEAGVAAEACCYGPVGAMTTLFVLSKFPELVDTVFLILKGKPIMMLQWWHHSSVLLYSWHAYVLATPSGILFSTMNYCVHSIMYFYFGVAVYAPKVLSFMKQPITILQLTQMVAGICFITSCFVYERGVGRDGGEVDGSDGCARAYKLGNYYLWCGLMYGSYFLLFAKFYVEAYHGKTSTAAHFSATAYYNGKTEHSKKSD